jgi:hypothetical protein
LVTGRSFDITDTTEYMEGAVVGLDLPPRAPLRGEFAAQSHLDLHGLITAKRASPLISPDAFRSAIAAC